LYTALCTKVVDNSDGRRAGAVGRGSLAVRHIDDVADRHTDFGE
jgi:hypothetical protein